MYCNNHVTRMHAEPKLMSMRANVYCVSVIWNIAYIASSLKVRIYLLINSYAYPCSIKI